MGGLVLNCDEHAIKKAAGIIKKGGLVVYPTDTLYGVGCSALDEDAIKKVFKAKKRQPNKPLSIAVCDLLMLRKYASFDDRAMSVMERFLPGPLTFILKKKGLPDVLTGGSEKVGIRVPESRCALMLVMKAGVPIVATSANISGREPPQTVIEAGEQLPEVDLILDDGKLKGPPSTVIDLTSDPPKILREGKKPAWEVSEVVSEIYGSVKPFVKKV
jgi:L-threonylcarbamoyladenylate synthase